MRHGCWGGREELSSPGSSTLCAFASPEGASAALGLATGAGGLGPTACVGWSLPAAAAPLWGLLRGILKEQCTT